ncbi:MAG: hypothetical protein GF392_01245, partial [Candidatus Omnitrophica bacterium]|nr:hypothetical protein [Candidatus Omnitrophota bacterium]
MRERPTRKDRNMKKILAAIMMVCFILSQFAPLASASEMQLLVDKLVEKGILTKEEARVLAKQAKEEAAQEKAAEKKRTARAPQREVSDNAVDVRWDNRLEFETRDGNFKGAIGGRVHADMVYVRAQDELSNLIRPNGDFDERNDRALIRRARLYMKGTVYDDFFYKLQYDFAHDINNRNEEDGFRGAYIGMKNIPYIGKFTVGQFKEPFGLEELTSSNDITFLERSLPSLFAPGFSWGAAVNNNWFDERVTLGMGAFRNSTSSGTMSSGNEWNFTTRVTGLPWYEAEDKLAHLGVSYSFRHPESVSDDEELDFDQRPELRTRDNFVNTGNFFADRENRMGFEGAVVYGPFSAQAEFMQSWVNKPNRLYDTGYFYGWYGSVSYFLTGEHRNYDKGSAK